MAKAGASEQASAGHASPNFGHLAKRVPLLASLGVKAERFVFEEPDTALSEPTPISAATFGGQCVDDLDNDGDDYNDGCDFDCVVHPDFGGLDFDYTVQHEQTKSFTIIGDGPFCMNNLLNFEAIFADMGMTAAQMLNWLEAPSGPRVSPVRFAWGGCFTHFAPGEATACHANAQECNDPAAYPFAGIGDDFGPSVGNIAHGYIGRVWRAVDDRAAAAASAADIHPVSMAVAVALRAPLLSDLQGQAYFPLLEFGGNNSKFMYGAAVALAPDGLDPKATEEDVGFAGRRVAHELGHTFGLEHDNAPGGFMGEYGGTLPIVDWEASSLLQIVDGDLNVIDHETQEYAWTQHAPSKWAPRPSGFGHTPCVNDGECVSNHPGLSCRGGWCIY